MLDKMQQQVNVMEIIYFTGICITAIMALRSNVITMALLPVVLFFMMLMDAAIAF